MRLSIHIDSATTSELRALLHTAARAGYSGEVKVGLNGPEHWSASTPMMPGSDADVVLRGFSMELAGLPS